LPVKDYDRAVQYYTDAIALNPNNAIYYGNRSLAYLRTECYGYALADASQAIQIDAKYIKGYYRRAASNMALGKLKAALKDYETVSAPLPVPCPRNHETDTMNQMYGFEGEVKAKYSTQMFQLFSEVFQWLPLAMCVNQRVLIMHGGLFSEDGVTLEQLRNIERNRQPPDSAVVGSCRYLYWRVTSVCFLSGNHETDTMNQMYGFEGEVKAKYSTQMFQLFSEVFQWLPLAMCVNQRVLIMHGGLFSEDGVTLEQLRNIERNRQPPDSGPMCDLLWSDPQPQDGRSPSKRGVSCQFGPDVTRHFLEENGLDYIIRSHEVKAEGYEVTHNGLCVTVFSAPNYCDQMGNKGAYIHLSGSDLKPKFHQFEAVPHPNVKPMMYANSLMQMGMM
ncbi:PREDICTED: serine/threonine-protein phosphatase 5, partial [Nanorana parkeri]|uniref:serine/threonine-protein phosphatase 5 n=1 Tax=Nanorana parkeri TaxID=125878 RepID=UPI000854598C